jgi:hypothetical protein
MTESMPGVIVNIVGERVALGPLTSAHVPSLVRWDNDWVTTRTTTIPPQPLSPDAYASGFPQALTVQDRTPTPSLPRGWRVSCSASLPSTNRGSARTPRPASARSVGAGKPGCWVGGCGTSSTWTVWPASSTAPSSERCSVLRDRRKRLDHGVIAH